MKVVIVGGSAGGASVAARLRRLDEQCNIILFDKRDTFSFQTCSIPDYDGDVIAEFSRVLNVDLRTHSEVIAIDSFKRRIYIRDWQQRRIYQENYDRLVLATGGNAITPDIRGVDLAHVFTLRNAADTDTIKRYISQHACQRALIVGAGFIGLEVVDKLHHMGMQVTLLDASVQVMNDLDYEMANAVHRHLHDKKINLLLNEYATVITEHSVVLQSGRTVSADLVVLAMGTVPDLKLAKTAELALGKNGGVEVNEYMQTSDKHIYALGDDATNIPLAGLVHKQARVVAGHICRRLIMFHPVKITVIAKVLDLSMAMTGSSEKKLRAAGVRYLKSYVDLPSPTGVNSNACSMIIKLLFAPDNGQILGAQIVGSGDVAKRIDVLAMAMYQGATIRDLVDLELAYAPLFSSEQDPINVAGMVATNMLDNDCRVIHWHELKAIQHENVMLIDVRTPDEYATQTIAGAINIPLDELRTKLADIPRDQTIVVFCNYGKKSYFAERILRLHGCDQVFNLSGGLGIYALATTLYGNDARQEKVRPLPVSEDEDRIAIDTDEMARYVPVLTLMQKG